MIGSTGTDRHLLDALAAAVDALDPAPASLAVRAWAALGERSDATPMPVLADSVVDEVSGGTRELVFGGLDLRLSRAVGGLRVHGVVRGAAVVVVRWPGGSARTVVDAVGRFGVERVPFGPVRCVVRRAGRDHATPWVVA
ncbi:hypothetical protein LZG04_13515 [Saccharothrix sp. S26]|uniref:hypothetical protein n=1 Tax=Saccharothrix sp. S26 TaxID=2907215 RepID=UPI001F281D81|nr:hypothetical protein [Saccharothrix sp. S26]MCE6995809.1 hypothetical protein [Saccharothrix sp. S26]